MSSLHAFRQMNNKTKHVLINLLTLFCMSAAIAQQSAAYDDPAARYGKALSLFQKEQYGAAAKAFEEVSNSGTSRSDDLMRTNAQYYAAVCALELDHDDGGYKLTQFIREHPENSFVKRAYFKLGTYQFDNKSYNQALNSFEKVEVPELTQEERTEYYYKKGYSQYKTGEVTRAKASFAKVIRGDSEYTPYAQYYYAVISFEEGDDATAAEYFELVKESRNFRKSVSTYLTHIYHRRGEYDKMLGLAQPAYDDASGKDKPALALMIGDAWYQQGEYEKALPYFEFYERTSRRSMGRQDAYEIGYTYFVLENYKAAIQSFQLATDEEDELAQNAYYHLGFSYLKTDQKKYASNAFASAYKLDFKKEISEDALFNYAKLTMEVASDPYNSAISALEDYILKYPDSDRVDEAYSYLAKLYLTTRNYKQALASMERIKSRNPAMQEAYQKICFYRGIELFNERNYDDAIVLLKAASAEKYDKTLAAEAVLWIGEAFYRQDNSWAAIKYYKEFLDNRASRELDNYSLAYYNLGYVYFNKKDYTNAISWFGKYVEYKGQRDERLTGDAMVRLGDCYFIGKDYNRAIRYYDNAIRSNTGSVDYALYQKAITQGASGILNDKIRSLKELINSQPKSTYADDAKYELAVTYMLLNNNREALDWYDRLVKDHPGSRFAVKSLLKSGLIYYNENRNELALKSLRRVVEEYPGTAESREALNSIRNIYIDQNKV
ncbi:MAG TPA: tetratricopeptide repeat protein, partial [Bacteroidales bacterium]|nr:tetratricopeptide repeat protein [Bacteroidales bacterium]